MTIPRGVKKVRQPYLCIQPHDVPYHVRAAAFPCRKHTHHARGMNDECALDGATRAGTQAPPLPISIKPCVVCPYRAAVILLIAQGWQVQRSLSWVTDASAGATHNVGCTFFRHKLTMLRHAQSHPNETRKQSPHHTNGEAEMHRALPPPQL